MINNDRQWIDGDVRMTTTTSTRFLGVWLDRKLTWKAHLKEVQQKLETQRLALTRLAAASWGFSLSRAREVYAKVIRSAMAYGATAFHKVTEPGGNAAGIAGSLRKEQTQCLRTVAGAYRATPVRALETETFIPPLDLYLNGRVAQFEGRIEESGMGQLIRDSCATIARTPESPTPLYHAARTQHRDNREGETVASHRSRERGLEEDPDHTCKRVERTMAERGRQIKSEA